jgi:hypothetical protein
MNYRYKFQGFCSSDCLIEVFWIVTLYIILSRLPSFRRTGGVEMCRFRKWLGYASQFEGT